MTDLAEEVAIEISEVDTETSETIEVIEETETIVIEEMIEA